MVFIRETVSEIGFDLIKLFASALVDKKKFAVLRSLESGDRQSGGQIAFFRMPLFRSRTELLRRM